MKAMYDARRSMLALRQMVEVHEAIIWALAFGLPVPDATEELQNARGCVDCARGVVEYLTREAA